MSRSRKAGTMAAVIVVVMGAGAGIHAIWPTEQASADNSTAAEKVKGIPVVLTLAKEMTFERTVVIAGNVQAKNYALVSARMPGPLDALFVDEGDAVEAGKTKLFQTDSLKLTKAVAIARQGLTVEEFSVKEKAASLEQVLAEKEQTEVDLHRYELLVKDNAISKQLYEQQATRVKQASAMVKHANALLALDKTKLEQARLALTIAEKDLDDSLVVAPISGWVSQRFKEPGEMAAAGTPVMRIEDLVLLEISVFLPEEFFAQVSRGETQMRIEVSGIDLGVRPVSYKSPTVHPKLRTFEVRALVDSPPEGVAPGCLANVVILLDRRSGVGVPSAAVQRRDDRDVVFVVTDGQARRLPLTTGLETGGWLEVARGDLPAGTPVVTLGQQLIEEGAPVSVIEESSQ
jgi:multidrug efflux pump subunit AcrA (membrane-fusion protein)